MRKGKISSWPFRVLALLCAFMFLFSSFMAGTYAWQSEQEVTNDVYGPGDVLVPVELIKLEKLQDGTLTEKPISGTVFYLFKDNGTQIGGRYLTDENGKINVQLPAGSYYFKEVSPSIGYTYDTDINGASITRYNFTVSEKDASVSVKAYNKRLDGDLVIRKTVENSDGSSLSEDQQNTAFEFTVSFSDGGAYAYRIDNGEEQMLASGGTLQLCSGQTATFDDLPFGLLYDVKEVPVEGYTVSGNGHRGNITADKQAVADFVNRYEKAETGSLTVSKEVKGENADPTKSFTFVLTIDEVSETFTLAHGETKEFTGIPLGAKYTVSEQSEDGDYFSSVNQYEGEVISAETVTLPFVNVYDPVSEDKFGSLTVHKQVIGDNTDPEKEFTFTVTFEGENAPENQTFVLKANESKTFENIPHGVTFTVTETDPAGYEPLINTASGSVVGDHTAEIVFTNKVPETPIETVKLTVKKLLAGELLDSDKERLFTITLTVNGEPTLFTLKADEIREVEIPYGAVYEVSEENYIADGFSQSVVNGSGTATEELIEVVITNSYVGEVRVEISGKKTWDLNGCEDVVIPDAITVSLKNGDMLVEKVDVKPDENNEWCYSFIVPEYNEDGTEAVYTVEEETLPNFRASYDGYNITNTYVKPIDVEPPIITKVVQGEDIPSAVFEFIFSGQHGTPMPDGSVGYRKELQLTGAGELEIGTIRYDKAGTYVYTVHEKNGGASGWTYDTAVYTVTVVITETDYVLSARTTVEKSDSFADDITFTNTFTQSKDETVIISGVKSWDHGMNPVDKRPDSIIVELYADGELARQSLVTAEDNWQYSFEMPKYSANGTEIVYTIDEADIKDYKKQIDGYDLINTYVGNPDIPDNPPSPPTGDNSNIGLWFALMILSLIGLIVTTTYGRRIRYEPKHLKK